MYGEQQLPLLIGFLLRRRVPVQKIQKPRRVDGCFSDWNSHRYVQRVSSVTTTNLPYLLTILSVIFSLSFNRTRYIICGDLRKEEDLLGRVKRQKEFNEQQLARTRRQLGEQQ